MKLNRLNNITRLSLLLMFLATGLKLSAQEDVEKIPVNMQLEYFKQGDGNEKVKVRIFYRGEGRKIIPVSGVAVKLFMDEVEENGVISNLLTDENGNGFFVLDNEKYRNSIKGKAEYNFIALMEATDKYEEAEEELTIKPSRIVMSLSEDGEEGKNISANFYGLDENGEMAPVPGAEVKFYVKRMVSLLEIEGEETETDEEGFISAICPSDIPGDANGNIILVARVEGHDEYGTVEFSQSAQWGVPLVIRDFSHRTFWSSRAHAPIALLIVFFTIIAGVWGTLGYVFFQLIKIRKLGKDNSSIVEVGEFQLSKS